MFIKFVVLLSSALLASGGPIGLEPNPMLDGRIVGGFPIEIEQVPWQVSLRRNGAHFCGASIIGEKWILTAGHCTNAVNQNPKSIIVHAGSTLKLDGGSQHKVKTVIQNKNFSMSTIDYDFSLLELEEPLQFSESVKPVKLVGAGQKLNDNTKCLVTGWGNTQSASESTNSLRGAEVPIVNQNVCVKAYRNFKGITPRMLCAGLSDKGGKDACQGDSGGPLVVYDDASENAVLVGVVSWGFGCARPSYPGVYARVTETRDWILENTGI